MLETELDAEEMFDLDEMLGVDKAPAQAGASVPGGRSDPRRRQVVCKHWLRGLCKRGDDCDFLHRYDMDRMPECLCARDHAPTPPAPPTRRSSIHRVLVADSSRTTANATTRSAHSCT